MQGLAQFLEQGGTLMYVNLVVSMITLAIIIDRAILDDAHKARTHAAG